MLSPKTVCRLARLGGWVAGSITCVAQSPNGGVIAGNVVAAGVHAGLSVPADKLQFSSMAEMVEVLEDRQAKP